MDDTEWIYGRTAEQKHERCYWRRVGFVIFLAIAGAIVLGPLMGCAASPPEVVAQVCYMRALGRTEDGHTVVLQACQSPEAFQAGQK
jgi:hypothetical protein